MKKLPLFVLMLSCSFFAVAQTQSLDAKPAVMVSKEAPLDKSPMDMAYFPADYPMLKTQNKATQAPVMRVIYSRPQKDNRHIFGELIEYNKVWRLGANEATEIEFFRDVTIGGKKVTKGRYTIYAIPTPSRWTMVINKDTDTWGAFVYDQKKDVLRIDLPVQTVATPVDVLSMSFLKTDKGAQLTIAWDDASVVLPIDFK
jgi:hypothetical protein